MNQTQAQLESKLLEFIATNIGGRLDFDGAYNYQCVDLKAFGQFSGFPITTRGNAIDYATNGMGDSYQKFLNTASFIPKKGMPVIFNKTKANGYCGHWGITVFANAIDLWILEQNGGTGNGDGLGTNSIRIRKIAGYKGVNCFFGVKAAMEETVVQTVPVVSTAPTNPIKKNPKLPAGFTPVF